MSDKTIRFIDSDYKELFRIPDGGSIKITYPPEDGRGTIMRACKYRDTHHFETLGRGGNMYHVSQFAEISERLGARKRYTVTVSVFRGGNVAEIPASIYLRTCIQKAIIYQ